MLRLRHFKVLEIVTKHLEMLTATPAQEELLILAKGTTLKSVLQSWTLTVRISLDGAAAETEAAKAVGREERTRLRESWTA